MSDEQLYRVAFSGNITGEYGLEETKRRFAELFKLPLARAERLFSGKEFILKDKVSEDVAMNFAIRIAEAGCECYIEPVRSSLIPSSGDRRHNQRRTRFRRAPRKGAAPDRRVLVGRRREDKSDGNGDDTSASPDRLAAR